MKKEIIPTILTHNKKEFTPRFKSLLKLNVNYLQIDFMDGKFVPPVSTKLKDVPNLIYYKRKYKKKFEAHLMVKNPETWINKLASKGFDKIIFHFEAVQKNKILNLINKIHSKKISCFIAINPPTSPNKVEKYLDEIDGVLFMGINPGFEGRGFMQKVYKNISYMRNKYPYLNIQVDGGVNDKTISKISKSGANIANSGSFISASKNKVNALNTLKKGIKNG